MLVDDYDIKSCNILCQLYLWTRLTKEKTICLNFTLSEELEKHHESLVSNYRVITGKYRRILRFLVFLLRYGLYRGKDSIIVRHLENSG